MVNILTIVEPVPTIQFSTASETVNEPSGTFSITVALSAASNQQISVPFTVGGSATPGVDYSGLSSSPLTIPAGQTSGTITGTLLPDFGVNQTMVFTLGSPINANLGATTVNTLTIVEAPPSVQFSAASETVNESAGIFIITVNMSVVSSQTVSVPFTLGGSAMPGIDYSGLTASPLVFSPGHTTAIITGNLLPDIGPDQTLTFTLGSPTNAVLGSTVTNTLTIGESKPTVQFNAASESVNQTTGAFSITVSLSSASNQVVSVPFTFSGSAVPGIDFSGPTASPLTIPAGQLSATISGTLLPDVGANQILIVTLGTPTNADLGSSVVNTLTIVEPKPTVQFTTASETINESAGTFSITVALSTTSNQPVSVPFTLSGSAALGVDYNGITASPLTIPAGQTSVTITGTLLPHLGASQTLIFTLGTPGNASLGATLVNTLTIVEPTPTAQFSVASETVNEIAGTFSISVALSGVSTQAVSVPFTLSGSAAAGTDYSELTASPLTIAAGQSSGTITGTLLADFGVGQTLVFTLGSPTNATLGSTVVNTLTIVEPSPSVRFNAASETVNQSAGAFSLTVTLSAASNLPVTLPFTLGGTATAGLDYSGVTSSPLTIPAGQTTATITGTLLADYGKTQTLIVTLGVPTNASLGSTPANTLTIVEPIPTVQFTVGQETIDLNQTDIEIINLQVVLSAPSNQAVTVTIEGNGDDRSNLLFNIVTGSPLTIPAGQTSAIIHVQQLVPPGFKEAYDVSLHTPTNATLGPISGNEILVIPVVPTVQFQVASEFQNLLFPGASTHFSVIVTLSQASTEDISVPFTVGGTAVSGTDYTGFNNSPVTIPAGQTSVAISGTIMYDPGSAKTIVFTLVNPTNSVVGATGVNTLIIYSGPPIIAFSAANETVNATAGTFSIALTSSIPFTQQLWVLYAVAGTAVEGTDYTGVSNPIIFPIGQTTALFTVTILPHIGADKTLVINLAFVQNPSGDRFNFLGSPISNTLTILELKATIQFNTASETVNAWTGAFSIPVSLSAATNQANSVPFTLGGSAVSGIDYTGVTASPLTIPAGQTSATITGTFLPHFGVNQNLTFTLGSSAIALVGSPAVNTLTVSQQRISTVQPLAVRQATDNFAVPVIFNDPFGLGVTSVDLYVSTNNGPFSLFQSQPVGGGTAGTLNFAFQGQDRNSYAFYSVAHNAAGGTESQPSIEASTYVPDLNPPITAVSGSSSYANGVFNIVWNGIDPDQNTGTPAGSIVTVYTYVVVDGSAPQLVSRNNVAPPSGTFYTGTTTFAALGDGVAHTYGFYSIGVDDQGQTEFPAAAPDFTFSDITYSASLAINAFSIEQGLSERSFIRTLDVTFNQPGSNPALQALASGIAGAAANTFVELEFYGENLNAGSLPVSSVSLFGSGSTASVTFSGSTLHIDLGPKGITGAPTTATGDGWYALGIDPTGNPSDNQTQWLTFFRLLGDVNGDGKVTGPYSTSGTDAALVYAAIGQSGALLNADVDGNGAVTSAGDFSETVRAVNHSVGAVAPQNFPQFQMFAGAGKPAVSAPLTLTQLQALVPAAIAGWKAAGVNAVGLKLLEQTPIKIADLGTDVLALEANGVILINASAAGYSWYVNAGAGSNQAFTIAGPGGERQAGYGSPASGRVDLLTVLEHELGHIVGLQDNVQAGDLMDISLGLGERRAPSALDVSALDRALRDSTKPSAAIEFAGFFAAERKAGGLGSPSLSLAAVESFFLQYQQVTALSTSSVGNGGLVAERSRTKADDGAPVSHANISTMMDDASSLPDRVAETIV